MSTAAATSSSSLTGSLQAAIKESEEAARTAAYNAAKKRIAEVEASQGVALKPGETAPAPSVAAKNSGVGGILKSLAKIPSEPGGLFNPANEAKAAGEILSSNNPISSAEGSIGEAVGEGIINWVKPFALKITLYGALIFGAAAMIAFGLLQLLEPIGVPGPKQIAGKAKDAAMVAAAA